MADEPNITRHQFIDDLIKWCSNLDVTSTNQVRYPFQSKNMTWAHQLKQACATLSCSSITSFNLENQLRILFCQLEIEIIPGVYRGRLTGRRWVRIIHVEHPAMSRRLPVDMLNYRPPPPI